MSKTASKLLFLVLSLQPGLLWAEEVDLLVGFHIKVTQIDLQYSDAIHATDLNSIEIVWHQFLNSWLGGNIKIGYLGVTQGSNPIPEAQSTNGEYLGIGLRFQLHNTDALKLYIDADYLYADTNSGTSGQLIEMRWHQLSAQLQAEFRLFQYSYLTLGAGTLSINGDQVASGTILGVSSFENANSEFGRLGIKFGVDPNSHIGIEVFGGAMEGGQIYFQRWF